MPIITSTGSVMQDAGWQRILAESIRDVNELSRALEIPLPAVPTEFQLLVPRPYLARIERGNPHDPLLLQVLPRSEENSEQPGFISDPLRETGNVATPTGLLQKYHGRVLVITTGACAINCRYCFRRHFPYAEHQPGRSDWEAIISHVRADNSIREVILSGGDPLVMNDRYLADLTQAISAIDHVEILRIHTRLPIVIPERICDELLAWIGNLSIPVVLVTHVNHANEIDEAVTAALNRLRSAGVMLLNQSVLLRDVNDTSAALASLSVKLFAAGVLPYYLHLLDPVQGAAHFDVPEGEARTLMDVLSAELPGYLVPRLVREIPGSNAKQLRYPMA